MASKTTLSEKIYQDLFNDITKHNLQSGQKLTLKMLKERFNVSHTPIREALARLSENGLVSYYSNCGVSVVEFSENDIKQIFQFIGELDALAILFCSNNYAKTPLLFELKDIIEKSNSALEENNISEWKLYSEQFHTVFYRYSQNDYLNAAAQKVRAKVEVLSCMYYTDLNINNINDYHNRIYDRIVENQFEEAAKIMREHLEFDMFFAVQAYKEYQNELHNK